MVFEAAAHLALPLVFPAGASIHRLTPMHANTHVPQSLIDELVTAFEQLQPADIARMGDWYDEHARFKDPFKDVQGLAAVQAIFQHMFDTLEQPRFVVTSCLVQGQGCFLVWDFLFRFKTMQPGVEQRIHGGSHLVFDLNTQGEWRIQSHRDYWDAAEELYEKLPWIGSLMRWLKRRINS
jgi:ketosteroid isomerase-like protein